MMLLLNTMVSWQRCHEGGFGQPWRSHFHRQPRGDGASVEQLRPRLLAGLVITLGNLF